ncbi:hypothetical protein [Paracoccus sp. SSJ]|uniref:hypothetical protein n=1 Tax=Paracoccus sp. SSJ TaxID=3050636 RepID=UPI00254F3D69|nr:hypothetical protein [Paracoccus sp. SSJ]MDK8873590.1 hypothetical protein [Paracoccus sp. SSJ]
MYEEYLNTFSVPWKKVVRKWAKMNIAYAEAVEDLPAWYVENSNSALFSSALWACDYPSICETDIGKQVISGLPGRRRAYDGRTDIEALVEDELFLFEAKKRHLNLSGDSRRALRHNVIARALDEALSDTAKIRSAAGNLTAKAGSIVFFSAVLSADYFGQGKWISKRRERIVDELEAFKRNMSDLRFKDVDLMYAAYFSDTSRLSISTDDYRPVAFGVCMTLPK